MDELGVASRRGIRYPCLHDKRDSPLGPCTTTTGAGAHDLAANLAGEEEALRSMG
jgi:hypothetical protein